LINSKFHYWSTIAGYTFHEFDCFWVSENPRDIMDFGRIREKYRKKLTARLRDPQAVFSAEFQQQL